MTDMYNPLIGLVQRLPPQIRHLALLTCYRVLLVGRIWALRARLCAISTLSHNPILHACGAAHCEGSIGLNSTYDNERMRGLEEYTGTALFSRGSARGGRDIADRRNCGKRVLSIAFTHGQPRSSQTNPCTDRNGRTYHNSNVIRNLAKVRAEHTERYRYSWTL